MTEQAKDPRLVEICAKLESSEPEKGLILCESLARTGSRYAMLLLGRIFSTGEIKGIERNHEKALFWLERAFDNGAVLAGIQLHRIYIHGKFGVLKDEKKSFHYVSSFEHIEQPNVDQALGVFLVASAYERGRGVEKDVSRAIQLYRQAAKSGHIPSKINWALLQIRRGNLVAIASLLLSAFQALLLLLFKGSKYGKKDPRLSL